MLVLYRDAIGADEMQAAYAEGFAAVDRSGDRRQAVMLHNNAAVHALARGDIHAARKHLEEATHLSEAIGVTTFNVQGNLGLVLREEGDLDGAIEMVADGLRLSRRRGDHYGLAYSFLSMGCIVGDRGDWKTAAELHGVAQALIEQIGQTWLFVFERFRQLSIEAIKNHLGDEEFHRRFAKGRGLRLDEAIQLTPLAPGRGHAGDRQD